MNRLRVETKGLPALIFWTAVWAVGAKCLDNPLLLPGPFQVLRCLWGLMGEAAFWQTTAVSLGRMLLGVACAVVLGTALAVLTGCRIIKTSAACREGKNFPPPS